MPPKVKITKENAELFVRYRDTSIRQSAMDRGNRQKVFAKAFAEKAKENATSDKELIVFRDSFASSMVPLLLENYKTVTLVDIRYMSTQVLGNFIDFHGQDVLFLYSTTVLNTKGIFR